MSDDPRWTPDMASGHAQTTDTRDATAAHAPNDVAGWEEADTLTRLGRITRHDPIADTPTAPLDGAALTAATNPASHEPTPLVSASSVMATTSANPMDAIPARALPDGAIPSGVHNANDAIPDDAIPDDAIPDDAIPDDAIPDDVAPTEAALPTPGEALRLPPWRRGPAERPAGRLAPSYSYGSLGLRKGGPNRLARASAHAEAQTQRAWRPRLIFVAFAALGTVGVVVAIILASVVTLAAGNLFAPATASPGTNTLVIPTTPPTSRTPGARASVAPGSGFLTGSPAAAPRTANLTGLTTAANSDWAQWGLTAAGDFNHKASGGGQIGNYNVIGGAAPQQVTDASVSYSWSDGQPTASASGSTTGVSVAGAGSGLTFSVPASTSARTLTVYVSAYHAQGVLTAHLTDNSATPYTDTTISGVNGVVTGVYTFTYQAGSNGHHLVIAFTDQTDYQPDGYVSLQAVTLN